MDTGPNQTASKPSLRMHLRHKTGAAHDALDQSFSQFDLQNTSGYLTFLKSHYSALHYLYGTAWSDPAARKLFPDDPVPELADDLAMLGHKVPDPWAPRSGAGLSAPGVAYVLCGSRLGARVLLKRVMGSPDETLKRATGYLQKQQDIAPWSRLLKHFETETYSDTEIKQIEASACQTFAIFEQALEDLQ